jgi:phosphatidylglycerol:prolipoprotein diacylglycerol transferase
LFAPAIALGVAIGRIGCFLRGCCFGKETSLPGGVDFGDGILRHPTQLWESIFMFLLFGFLMWKRTKNPKPGELFRILGISYFGFRFLIEFIRVEKIAFFGLTWFQIICLLALIYLFWFWRFRTSKNRKK